MHMEPIEFNFRGKRYRLKPAGLAAIAIVLIAVIALIVVLIASLTGKKEEEKPEDTVEETADINKDYDASAGVIDKKEFDGTILIETEDAGIEYVESTLFLGDSNTARFLNEINPETKKTYASKQNAIGVVGMGIDAIAAFPCMDFSTGRYSMPQSVKILQPERVIITMGTNNLYGKSTETTSFIERYTAGIRAIEKAYPSVDIIVNSIPPVSRNTTYTNVSMTQIDAYNKAIAKMCKDNKWMYLNSAETLKDEKTGFAKDGYMVSSDGLHFSNKGLAALFTYIRTHSWITDDDRPKPLAAIPTIIGVPDGLFKTDPLTNEEYKEDPAKIEDTATPEASASASASASAEPTATPTPTPAPTATATPVPEPSAAEKACAAIGGKWTSGTCACPVPSMIWDPSSYTCGCPSGMVYDQSQNACVVPPPPSTDPTPVTPSEEPQPSEQTDPTPTPEQTPDETTTPTESPVTAE